MVAMGLARYHAIGTALYWEGFKLHEDARDLVLRVATEPDSRFRALARTLLDLERGRVTTQATGQTRSDLSDMNYARSVAHEIRNKMRPLSTHIRSLWAELGEDQPDFERRQELRSRIDRYMDQLNEFANDAVRLSAAVQVEELVLAEVVSEAVKATESERNGRITVVLAELGGLKVVGARRDWSTAFINMFRNSAQVRAGKGTVWISIQRDNAGGLHIYVDDDGPGVPEDLRERIFDDGYSTRGGSGVGLALARRAAILSGGTLTCQESPQGGCRFHFVLPRRSIV
jgi:signal transduction histidine kinase